MKKITTLLLSFLTFYSFSPAYAQEYKIENYLVINGFSHHLSPPPKPLKQWNENNYGLSYNGSYQPIEENYRYGAEIGYLKESFGRDDFYLAGSLMKDLTNSPRFSLGVMAGLSYRTTTVRTGPFLNPVFDEKKLTVIGGAIAQLEIPNTPITIQTTFIPKIKDISPGVIFMQMMIKF